jgi:hypothetical protein
VLRSLPDLHADQNRVSATRCPTHALPELRDYLAADGRRPWPFQKLLERSSLQTTLTYVATTAELVSEHREHSPVDAMLHRRLWTLLGSE